MHQCGRGQDAAYPIPGEQRLKTHTRLGSSLPFILFPPTTSSSFLFLSSPSSLFHLSSRLFSPVSLSPFFCLGLCRSLLCICLFTHCQQILLLLFLLTFVAVLLRPTFTILSECTASSILFQHDLLPLAIITFFCRPLLLVLLSGASAIPPAVSHSHQQTHSQHTHIAVTKTNKHTNARQRESIKHNAGISRKDTFSVPFNPVGRRLGELGR